MLDDELSQNHTVFWAPNFASYWTQFWVIWKIFVSRYKKFVTQAAVLIRMDRKLEPSSSNVETWLDHTTHSGTFGIDQIPNVYLTPGRIFLSPREFFQSMKCWIFKNFFTKQIVAQTEPRWWRSWFWARWRAQTMLYTLEKKSRSRKLVLAVPRAKTPEHWFLHFETLPACAPDLACGTSKTNFLDRVFFATL